MDVIEELGRVASSLGGSRWVQGPGGNASVKDDDGNLWIKASGARFADTARAGKHVTVPVARVDAATAGDVGARQWLDGLRPRASLEASFHTVPARVVAHTHPLGVLLRVCRASVTSLVRPGVAVVPYAQPGLPLSDLVHRAVRENPSARMLLLRNHGLVSLARSAAEAVSISEEALSLLGVADDRMEDFDACSAAYTTPATHTWDTGCAREVPATSPEWVHAPPRFLFPDAVVFGARVPLPTEAEPLAAIRRGWKAGDPAATFVTPSGRRFLAASSELQLAYASETLAAHAWLMDRIGEASDAVFLRAEQADALRAMPEEKYRLAYRADGKER